MSLARALAVAILLLAAGEAGAQVNLVVAPSAGNPPVANAVTRGRASSISFDVTNTRPGTVLRQLQLRLPLGYVISGGVGPPGWTVTGVTNLFRTVTFRVSSCDEGGLATGTTATFRVDATAPNTTLASDATDALGAITGTDPCSSTTGWTETTAGNVRWARKALLVTGSVSPPSGAPPLAASASYTVTNLSSGTRTVTLAPLVSPAAGWTGGACTPASRSLASGASGAFSCAYTFTAAGSYAVGATATGTNGTSAVGVQAGTVLVGSATAAFAFDTLVAGLGDQVRATMTVQNAGTAPLEVTPPTYAQLELQNLTPSSGTADPAAVTVAGGESAQFVYALDVTGAVGASYVAAGTAATGVGPTNLAVTPPGTVSASRVEWTPPAVVRSRTAAPYGFTVTVANGSATAVSQVRIVNPQNGTWTGLANVSAAGLSYAGRTTNGSTTYLQYTGSLAPGATATLRFSFTGVPAVTQTTPYPFQVRVYPSNGGTLVTTYALTASVAVPIPDVGQPSVLSNGGGQLLEWVNTSRADAAHEGVVIFRTAAPGVPTVPADFVDYTLPANRPADFFYADGERSTATAVADQDLGAYNYRICNYDALLVYSSCNTGFWNGAGWLDSAAAPAEGWTHQLGGAVLLQPGVVAGGHVAVATNAPSLALLDAVTGQRRSDPVALGALPSNGTPSAEIAGVGTLVFAADAGGTVTAISVADGLPVWQRAKAGESFVAGVTGALEQYATQEFQDAYQSDVLFLSSTTGHVLAVNAATGDTLWTLDTGVTAGVRANTWYDAANNRLYVPTNGGGLRAYDLDTSSSTQAPSTLTGWNIPAGTFRVGCVRAPTAAHLACVDTSGDLLLVDRANGDVVRRLPTGSASPSMLARVTGATPGYVVSSASRVVRVTQAAGDPPTLTAAPAWSPGLTLAPALPVASEGAIYVAASDRRLHKLSLADGADTGLSVQVTPQPVSVLLGAPAIDTANDVFLFGTEDGRLWAVPLF